MYELFAHHVAAYEYAQYASIEKLLTLNCADPINNHILRFYLFKLNIRNSKTFEAMIYWYSVRIVT